MLLSLAYTGRSKLCQREQWFIFRVALSPRIRGCRHVSVVFADRRHYFQQFYLLFGLPFGRGRTNAAIPPWMLLGTGLLSSFISLFCFSSFFVPYERDSLRNCNTIQCAEISFNNCKRWMITFRFTPKNIDTLIGKKYLPANSN